jgi:hypothetical protein
MLEAAYSELQHLRVEHDHDECDARVATLEVAATDLGKWPSEAEGIVDDLNLGSGAELPNGHCIAQTTQDFGSGVVMTWTHVPTSGTSPPPPSNVPFPVNLNLAPRHPPETYHTKLEPPPNPPNRQYLGNPQLPCSPDPT